jgi:hypothetical protein
MDWISEQQSPLERGTGLVIGLANIASLRPAKDGMSARNALEVIVHESLQRPPCVISFSGGRDSSAILAVATHVARRDGLALPIPVSLTFPECDTADETDWQEIVVRHLGLPDWERPAITHELDIIGPIAAAVLQTHGVQWPFNAFFHVPIFDRARGGSVLSGVGGDETFSSGWSWDRENALLRGSTQPKPLDPIRLAVSVAPRPIRGAFLRLRARSKRPETRPAWLRPQAFAAVSAARARVAAAESLSFSSCVCRVSWRMQSRLRGARSMHDLAKERDVQYQAPFFDERFLGALTAERGWRMFDSRSAAMDELFGDLLPMRVRSRSTKAWFDIVFFNRYARAFAAQWDGSGVDIDYVDPDELRRGWMNDEEPDARTYGLLQGAWLAQQRVSLGG